MADLATVEPAHSTSSQSSIWHATRGLKYHGALWSSPVLSKSKGKWPTGGGEASGHQWWSYRPIIPYWRCRRGSRGSFSQMIYLLLRSSIGITSHNRLQAKIQPSWAILYDYFEMLYNEHTNQRYVVSICLITLYRSNPSRESWPTQIRGGGGLRLDTRIQQQERWMDGNGLESNWLV